jgi:hypothetical protein
MVYVAQRYACVCCLRPVNLADHTRAPSIVWAQTGIEKLNRTPGMDAVTVTTICHVDDRVVVTLDKACKSPPGRQSERE